MTFALSAGRAAPLGATVDGDGVNFAVFSDNATAMYLCLFDAETGEELARTDQQFYSSEGNLALAPDGETVAWAR